MCIEKNLEKKEKENETVCETFKILRKKKNKLVIIKKKEKRLIDDKKGIKN